MHHPGARCIAPALVAALLAVSAPASAQVFGKNKVQYEPLDWSVLETPHLRLHYYAEEESLARHLAVYAESVCVEFDNTFRLASRPPVNFLLYSVHHVFQQTNATQGFISEGTGGLTELIKGRVLLPHTGSWHRLRWVTRHELVHSYMLEKLARVMKDHRRGQSYMPPLWFTEGLAEFYGTTWDADAEGLLRDAVVSGEATPLTRSEAILGTVLMYKEGQSFLLYLAEKYGEDRIVDVLDNWYRSDNFETTFRLTFGVTLAKADEEWFSAIRRRYYPMVATAQPVTDVARRLTPRGSFNLGPRVLPGSAPGDTALRFCYFSAGEAGVDLVLNEPHGRGRRETRLLRGGGSPQFESFHLFQNRPDASPSGMIALSSKRGGRDALYMVDAKRRKVVRQFEFDNLVAINDPAIAPGDTALVFSAQDFGGRSDLYRVWWRGEDVRVMRLTNDDFDDLEPDVSPDGRWIAFASDRGDRGGRYSLFRMPFEGGTPEILSEPPAGDDRQPVYSPDGEWLAFRSTRHGTSDLYVRDAEPSLEARRVTSLLGPAYDPDWMHSGKGLVFNGQHAITFQAYQISFDPDTLKPETEIPEPRQSVLPVAVHTEPPRPYQRRLGLDLVSNAISLDPGMSGTGGGGQVALSDVLGNEQLYIFLANDSERFGNFWDGFELGLTYLNRANRLNWGVGVFRLTQLYDVDLNQIRREKRLGMMGLASYPFSKFSRIEASVLIRNAQDHRLRSGESKDVNLVSNYLALVRDNTRWTYMGPSGGSRMYLSTGFTRDLSGGEGDYATLQAEYRSYLSPIPQFVIAQRVQGQASTWRDAQQFYLGGWQSIRGFDRREMFGVQTALLQTEIRFPLLRNLTLAVPAPWRFPAVTGAVFADAAWSWQRQGENSGLQLTRRYDDRAGAVGFGFFVLGGYVPALRWDYVWVTRDFMAFTRKPRTQFSLGWNF